MITIKLTQLSCRVTQNHTLITPGVFLDHLICVYELIFCPSRMYEIVQKYILYLGTKKRVFWYIMFIRVT